MDSRVRGNDGCGHALAGMTEYEYALAGMTEYGDTLAGTTAVASRRSTDGCGGRGVGTNAVIPANAGIHSDFELIRCEP